MRTLWTLVAFFGLGVTPAFSQIDATREDHVMGSLGIAAYDPETETLETLVTVAAS